MKMLKAVTSMVFCLMLSGSSTGGQESEPNKWQSSERNPFVIVNRFIDAFYPNLSLHGGELSLLADRSAGGGVSANFGPSKKKELVAIVPVERVEEFTGCVLDRNTTHFDSEEVHWIVEGMRRVQKTKCRAEFEPFEGTLMSVF